MTSQLEDNNFYSNDPIARLLIDKLHLTPITFALIWTLIVITIGFVTALIADTLTDYLRDWIGWLWNLLLTPGLAGYYLWSAYALADLFQDFQGSEVVKITAHDMSEAREKYQYPWRWILSVGIAVIVGSLFFNFRQYTQAALVTKIGLTITFTIGTYMASMLVLTLIFNIWVLRQIFGRKEIHINPLHPDRSGGLKALGNYSLKTAYLVAMFGILVGVSIYRIVALGLAQDYWVIYLSVPVYIAIALACFFVPLSTTHIGMKKAKDELLDDIAHQFQQEYQLIHKGLNKNTEPLKDKLDRIQHLQVIYELTDRFPVWPFDVGTVRRFLVAITGPLIPPLIGILIDTIFN